MGTCNVQANVYIDTYKHIFHAASYYLAKCFTKRYEVAMKDLSSCVVCITKSLVAAPL